MTGIALPMGRRRPRFDELEVRNPCDSIEISTVVRHEDQPCFTARHRQEDVAAQRQPFTSHKLSQHDP